MGQAGGHKRGGTKPRNVKLRPAPAAAPPTAAAATTAGPSKKDKGKKAATKGSSSKHQDDDDADAAVDDSGYGDGQVKVPAEEEDEQDEDAFRDSLRRDRPPLEGCVVCLSGLQEPERVSWRLLRRHHRRTLTESHRPDGPEAVCASVRRKGRQGPHGGYDPSDLQKERRRQVCGVSSVPRLPGTVG